MKLNHLAPLLLLPAAVSLLQGCAHPTSASTFTPGQAQQVQSVTMGVVETVRPVTIQPGPTGVGAVAGGAMGGLAAGSTIGGGHGSILAGMGGALLGGMAGNAVESRVTRRAGVEIGVRLDSGQLIAVTQDADQPISPGDRVRVLSGGGVTRVTR